MKTRLIIGSGQWGPQCKKCMGRIIFLLPFFNFGDFFSFVANLPQTQRLSNSEIFVSTMGAKSKISLNVL